MSNPKVEEAIAAESRNGTEKRTPSHLAHHDISYWRRVNDGMKLAQDQLNQAAQLEEQAQRLRTSAIALQGAFESHLVYLGETYDFDPKTTIPDPEGKINRVEQPA